MKKRTAHELGYGMLAVGLGMACNAAVRDPGGSVEPFAPNIPVASGPNGSAAHQTLFDGSDIESSATPVDGHFDGQTCAELSTGAESLPAVLLVLVDVSGSMNEAAPGTSQSKWNVTRQALLGALAGMPAEASVGVSFYPNVPRNSASCIAQTPAVPIAALGPDNSQQRQAIQQAFAGERPSGGTPTHDAYHYALSVVEATPLAGPRFVVLITDGIPTYALGCVGPQQNGVDPAPAIAEMGDALGRGVRTFVIGSPGSEAGRGSLSRMAEAGGTALPSCSDDGPTYCHFDMTTQSDLGAGLDGALQTITSQALSCNYSVPESSGGGPVDPAKVNVLYTPPGGPQVLLPQSTDTACNDGWQYLENEKGLRLCPSTCERIRADHGTLNLEFGCVTQVR